MLWLLFEDCIRALDSLLVLLHFVLLHHILEEIGLLLWKRTTSTCLRVRILFSRHTGCAACLLAVATSSRHHCVLRSITLLLSTTLG